MLRGDRAAEVERRPEDLVPDEMGEPRRVRVVAGEDQVWVQVAIARVAEGRAAHAVCARDARDRRKELRHARPRHADVLHPHCPLPLERPQREPASLAQPVGFLGVLSADDRRRPGGLDRRLGRIELARRRRARCIGLDQEHRRGIAIEPELVGVVHGHDRFVVHELERHRDDSRPGHRRHGLAGRLERAEEREHRGAGSRQWSEAEGRLGDDPEGALRAHEQVRQRVARGVLDVAAAGPDHRAVGEHHLESQHPVAGLAVLHAAQPAGIGAEIAADRALLVARGVRRVEQALGGDGLLELRVDHARLGDDAQVVTVDLEDRVHARDRDRQGALDARGPARQPRSRATRDHRHAMPRGEPQQGRHLLRRGRECHGAGKPSCQVRGLVEAVALAVGDVGEEAELGQLGAHVREQGIDRRHGLHCADPTRSQAPSRCSCACGPAPTRRSARSAWGICRNEGGSIGRQASHVATSHVETTFCRRPHESR